MSSVQEETKKFFKKVDELKESVEEHGVLAMDIHNNGYAPANLSGKIRKLIDVYLAQNSDIERPDEIIFCWVDSKHVKNMAKEPYGKGKLQHAIKSINFYYGADDDDGLARAAQTIVKAAKDIGLHAEWDGSLEKAVKVSLSD